MTQATNKEIIKFELPTIGQRQPTFYGKAHIIETKELEAID